MKTNKILSLITAAVCAVNIAAPAFAESEYISIKSASDLVLLSRNCISDSYSVGKVFVLLNDIDLSDTDFEPIGSFGGTFDGGGYTISGLDIEAVDSVRGFIGTVAETGVVKNLNVSGSISPKNEYEKSNFSKISGIISGGDNDSLLKGVERYTSNQGLKSIGGIAGENKGRITNCTYSGTVSGYENIGGIVGENYESGRIECCTNAAVVTGTMNTGGIAGKNYGLIKWSYNNGLINPEANENAQNTGGIAGRSYGAVTESVNNAEIGYKNAGYNTGGITGCQNGYIAECTNYGHIQGRKDIGGITGQFEPYTNINFDEDEFQQRWEENTEKLKSDLREADDEISNKYDTLKSDIDDFFGINERRDSFNDTVGDISGSVSDLNGRIGDSVEDTNGRIADSVDDASGRLSDRISDAVDMLDEIGGEVSDASGRIADRMTESGDNFDSSLNDAVDVLERLGDNADDMRADSANTTEAVINLLDAANASLESGEVNREELINSLIDALEDLDMGGVDVNVDADMSAISRSIREIANNFNDNMDDIAEPMIRISDAIDDFLDAYESKSGDIDEFIENLKNLRDEIAETPAPSNSSSASEPTEAPALIPTIPPINQDTLDNIIDIIGNLFAMSGTTAYAEEDMSTTRKLLEMDIKDMDISINRRVAGESMDAALIKYCINEGAVDGISDIGGIAGAVGFDSQNNPEDNLNVSGDYSLNPSMAIKAVIIASIIAVNIAAQQTSAGGSGGFAHK
ncbi:MAG: hypothetical protein LIO59_00625 [Oscillospiraceae bacterium]|nr:hypothetical protein [Oscillospiraceae bacterium]